MPIDFRTIGRNEIGRIWREIDRSEFVKNIYRLEDGQLIEETIDFDVKGWPPGEQQKYMPLLLECHDRGGFLCGAFSDKQLVGVVVLENGFIGRHKDQLQLKFLHVSRDFRKRGLGRDLFVMAVDEARKRGAKTLYVSSCESKNTVDFWMHLGCVFAPEIDEELYRLEPEDIHLLYRL